MTLSVRVPDGVLDDRDLLDDERLVTRQERTPADHHVDLVGAGAGRRVRFRDAAVELELSGREATGDRRDPNRRVTGRPDGVRHRTRVHAQRRDRGDVGIIRHRPLRLRRQGPDLPR